MHPYLYRNINISQSILTSKFRNNNAGVKQGCGQKNKSE